MTKREKVKVDLDLDRFKGKPISKLTPEELEILYKPFQTSIGYALKAIQDYEKQFEIAKKIITPMLPEIFATQKKMAELIEQTINPPMLKAMQESFAKTIDSRRMVESLLQSLQPSLKLYRQSFIDLGTLNSIGRVNQFSTIQLQVTQARATSQKEARIEGLITSETSYKSLKIVQVSDIELIVGNAESRLTEKFSQEFSDMRGMIKQLADNKIKTFPVVINSIEFDRGALKLTINDRTIEFSQTSKQTELCNLFFSAIERVKAKLHIEDILEEYGETRTKDRIKEWDERFYQAVRHLNAKIAAETGCKDFILYHKQYYWVNPEYLKLF